MFANLRLHNRTSKHLMIYEQQCTFLWSLCNRFLIIEKTRYAVPLRQRVVPNGDGRRIVDPCQHLQG